LFVYKDLFVNRLMKSRRPSSRLDFCSCWITTVFWVFGLFTHLVSRHFLSFLSYTLYRVANYRPCLLCSRFTFVKREQQAFCLNLLTSSEICGKS